MEVGKLRIAVIGTGLAGLAAAWKLSEKHDIIVFEKDPFLGGIIVDGSRYFMYSMPEISR